MARTRTRRGRTLALVAAVGAIAVVAVVAARWEQLATRYYLYRLESDDSYLEHLIDLPNLSTAQEKALREHCQTDEGGAELLSVFVFDAIEQRLKKDLRAMRSVVIRVNHAGVCSVLVPGKLSWTSGFPADHHRFLHLIPLLRLLKERQFLLKSYKVKVEWDAASQWLVFRGTSSP